MSEGSERLAALEATLSKLAERVRAELPERARALRAASELLASEDATARSAIQRAAHMVRGTAGSHGMTALTAPAAELELGAATMTTSELASAARALADQLDQTATEKPAPAAEPAKAMPPPTAGLVKPLAGLRVLAIDDDAPTRRLLAMTLVNLGGASGVIAETSSAFFAALDEHAYDVVIVDAMMPDTNGLECLERIASSPLAHPNPQYFVLSAAAPEELGWILPASLPVTWLRKPFRPRELLDAISARVVR